MKLLRKLNLSLRLFILIGIFLAGSLVYGAWSFRTLDQVKVNGPLYGQIVASKDLIADTMPPPLYIIESYLVCLKMVEAASDGARLDAFETRLLRLRDEHNARRRHWRVQQTGPELAHLLDGVTDPAALFYEQALTALLPALRKGDRDGTAAALATMARTFDLHRSAVDALVAKAGSQAALAEAAARARIEGETSNLMLIFLVALVVGLAAAALIKRSITAPLDDALKLARRVAGGDMRPHTHTRYNDEPGQLLEALNDMSSSLAAMLQARNESEQSLRLAKEMTERLIDNANVAIVGLDRKGRVLIFNKTASGVTGYAAEAVFRQVWRELPVIGPEQAANWPAQDGWDAVRDRFEHLITTASGEQRRIAWQNTLLGEEGGEVAMLAFGVDVTEQRAALEAMTRAQQLAEAATQSKSEFLANMSHEIRTPMNAVIGMTRLALNTDLNDRQRNYLEKVDGAAHGLLGIINDILDFSKIEAGKLHFERRALRLGETLDHLAGLTVFRAQEKGLELLFDIAPDVPSEMLGDPMRLGQVLLNLVNNAIKFTDRGEIIVAVRLMASSDEDVTLHFEVRDTGVGITPAQSERLFESFAQADASTTRIHGGTGLGLVIARKLVGMMDGRMWLDSEYGKGSRFQFTARFGRSAGASDQIAASGELQSLRALVVDDNAAAREIMQGILESMQLRAGVCVSAQDAIAELTRAEAAGDPYNVVLMDWIMPTMDGLAAIRAIRANPAISPTLSIIMVTAYSRDDLLSQSEDIDQLGVLDKPVTPSSVLDAIMRGFRSSHLHGQARGAPRRGMAAALNRLRGATVLLVEDNEVNRELAVDILTGMGLKVSVAVNGKVAVDMVDQEDFDAVLMDIQMPVMDGYEATRAIRAKPRFARLPILAMTANAMSGDRERCLEAGMNDHISKPIIQEVLAMTLAQALDKSRPGNQDIVGGDGAGQFPVLRRAGIDVDAGMARVKGNEIAYRKLMHSLRALDASFDGQLRESLAGGAAERARRHVHNLRGIAENLGARQLAASASVLEQAIAAGAGTEAPLAQLKAPFDAAQAAVAEQLGT